MGMNMLATIKVTKYSIELNYTKKHLTTNF